MVRERSASILGDIICHGEAADLSHLGQLITYATGSDAPTAVWVATGFRRELADALHRLNAWTRKGVRFYAVRVEVVRRTEDAEPEPRFRKVVWPGDQDESLVLAASRLCRPGSPTTPARSGRGAILGQRRSTVDLRQLIAEGGVLFVSTSQAVAGKDVSALVGASILNLVDAVIREQGSLPPEQRRGALVVVDEMQALPGVDYESMLSELGKFGGSFVLATQSLSRLSELSPTLQDTLLANAGCLAVFQVAAADARELVWELSKERLSEEDITSLPVHHAYVRATVGGERQPPFSMAVMAPGPGDPAVAAGIREGTASYTTPLAELESEDEALLAQFHEGLDALDDEAAKQSGSAAPPPAKGKKKPRTRKRRGPEAA